MNKILIINGTVCNADGIAETDIVVESGKITAIGKVNREDFPGASVMDARGKLIFPGGIDPHVHLALPTPAGNSSDDFITGSRAALAGGTTSFIDFVTPRRDQSLLEALAFRRAESSASLCNHSLHMGISGWNQQVATEVTQCIKQYGITSFKAYLAYKESIGISPEELKSLMEIVGPAGGTVLVHCEDGDLIRNLQKQFLEEGKTGAAFHALSRPPVAEIQAIEKVIHIAAETACPVYIVHTSTGTGAGLIRKAKQAGIKVYGETCIQYLMLNESVYDPAKENIDILPFIISPPVRSENDREQLWEELKAGTFDTVATDHCPFNLYGQKDRGMNDFTKVPNGAGGIEHRLSLLYTYGVLTGKLSLMQFVSLTSTRAADIFGWGDRKGRLKTGYDADLVIWNPEPENIISVKTHVQLCDSDIYEGIRTKGKVETVILNGKVVFQSGNVVPD